MVNSGCATKAMCELREDISDVVGPVVVGEVSCCQGNICSGSGIQMCVYQTQRDSVGCYTNVLFTVKPQVNSVTSRQALSLDKGDNSTGLGSVVSSAGRTRDITHPFCVQKR